jgi:hypothetical protein
MPERGHATGATQIADGFDLIGESAGGVSAAHVDCVFELFDGADRITGRK